MTDLIRDYLNHNNVCKSSDIKTALKIEAYNITRWLSPNNDLDSISKILPKNEAIIYHKNDIKKLIDYILNLHKNTEMNSIYAAVINTLFIHNGIMNKNLLNAFCGFCDDHSKTPSFDDVINHLAKHKIISINNFTIELEYKMYKVNIASSYINKKIVCSIAEWLKKTGFASYNALTTIFDENKTPPQFGRYNWSITAPSYILPFKRVKDKQGFIVADIFFIDKDLSIADCKAFFNKINRLNINLKIAPFIPFLIAPYFEKKCLDYCKKNGILAITLDNLFGITNIGRTLLEISKTIENKITLISDEKLEKYIKNLDKLSGQFGNVNGTIFELMTASFLTTTKSGNAYVNRNINGQEIDVIHEIGDNIDFYECKAYKNNTITLKNIEDWLDKCANLYDYFCNFPQYIYNKTNKSFHFWTLSSFEPDALEKLQSTANYKKYKIFFQDGKDIRNQITSSKHSEYTTILNNYLLNANL